MSIKWAYGITTVPSRFDKALPTTLRSLEAAGFPEPRLFIDGYGKTTPDYILQYQRTYRDKIRAYGNWLLGVWELYIRDPAANYYAMFEDDLISVRNLRQYLETCQPPVMGYWNLYTFPHNEIGERGWYRSNQKGLGAVGLVFTKDTLQCLFTSKVLSLNVQDAKRGYKNTDGAVVTAMNKLGYREYVHSPSLLQHQQGPSAIGNSAQPQAETFPGEQFDAMELRNVQS